MRHIRDEIEGAFDTALAQRMEDCLTILVVSPGGMIGALAVPTRMLPAAIEKIGTALADLHVASRDRYAKEQIINAMEAVDIDPGAVGTAAQFAYYRFYRDQPTEAVERMRFMSILAHDKRLVVLASDRRDEIIASALTFIERGELSKHEATIVPSQTIN